MATAADRVLVVALNGQPVGRVAMDRHGRLRFTYEESWRSFDGAFPLSLSMPLAAAEHGHAVVDAYLAGLLPDREQILDSWARRFQASRNPFALLSHVGEDCAGAFQFLRPERLDEIQKQPASLSQVRWLTEDEIGERLKTLRSDPAAWRCESDTGQFSLGGAQAKTSLLLDQGRWGVPEGRIPTTHILKPSIPGFDGHEFNEHVCLELARALGLPVADSEVRRFGAETAVVLKRFDRATTSDLAAGAAAAAAGLAAAAAASAASREPAATARMATAAANAAEAAARADSLGKLAATTPILRLHQEDLCQALGVAPRQKYQSEGGPGPREVVDMLRTHSSDPEADVWTFVDALSFNWLIGGTDAHAKNFAILHGGGGRVRLAPLYDLGSILPYDDRVTDRLKLSMKVGGTYRLREVDLREWRRAANELGLRPEEALGRIAAMCTALPGKLDEVIAAVRAHGIEHPILERMAERLSDRARGCSRSLEENPPPMIMTRRLR